MLQVTNDTPWHPLTCNVVSCRTQPGGGERARRVTTSPEGSPPFRWCALCRPCGVDPLTEFGAVGLVGATARASSLHTRVASIGMSPTVVARAYGILDVAEKDRRILSNPARGVRLPCKVTKCDRRYLSHDELWSVAAASGRPALVLTLGYCGLRWGELVALRVRDVNFLRHRIAVTRNIVEVHGEFYPGAPKTHESRQGPVPAAVLQQLAAAIDRKAPAALILDDRHGGYMRRTRASTRSRSWWCRR